jgi:hypothetical protein
LAVDLLIDAPEVIARFVRADEARARLRWWTSAPVRAQVVPAVMAHVSRVVLTASPDDVQRVRRATGHPLKAIEKTAVDAARHIRDWTAPFAVAYVLHFITEADGEIPTWERFRQASIDSRYRHMLADPADEAIHLSAEVDRVDVEVAKMAMTWRIGLFYYSFLREQWIHAYLRSKGVPILQHPLADVVFGVDGWVNDTVMSVYLRNGRFRSSDGAGRKRTAPRHLGRPSPGFRYVDMELTAIPRRGEVHLPTGAEMDRYVSPLMAGAQHARRLSE